MREAAFIKKNQEKWKQFEEFLKQREENRKAANPDQLADIFIILTDDLAYARTFYPESRTVTYLNSMASRLHQEIYKNRKESSNRFVRFWLHELPLVLRSVHREMLIAFVVFMVAVVIGAVSTHHDDGFVRMVMGDNYVNMTLRNIENDDPMAVYKSMNQSDMFMMITFNNVRVSFTVFVASLVSSLGTMLVLFYNGVMLGAFQYFFYQKGLFITSFLTIWIHGTLEISSIVIAGTAGIVMGNSFLFPGTYPRLTAFRMGAKKGLKIIAGLVPVFIVAGFLESFVTRLTEMPILLKIAIIGGSAWFIIYYFVLYPIKLSRKVSYKAESELGQANL